MRRRFTASWLLSGFSLLAALPSILMGADPLYDSADRKLNSILNSTAKPGSQILFTPAEISAWTAVKAREQVGDGLRDPHVKLENGSGTAIALVDFLKMRQAKGKSTNALMARMLDGERLLKADLRVVSEHGQCTVFLTQVDLDGTVISGAFLDYLIKTFLLTMYPDVKLGEPLDLTLNMDRIDLLPEGVRVTMKE